MIKKRNMLAQVLLMVITLGLYSVYWFFVTSQEMIRKNGSSGSAGLWTFLLFVPFGSLYSYWKHSHEVETVSGGRLGAVPLFILWIFFSPAVWFMTQRELNRLASAESA